MRRKFICGNWKMHKNREDAFKYIRDLSLFVKDVSDRDIVIAAPFTLLAVMKSETRNTNISIGAQNMHHEEQGAYTGEISVNMVKDYASYVILGHSERRKYFNESNDLINKKILLALKHNLKVIFCLGESQQERNENRTKNVVETQLRESLKDVSIEQIENVVIAYEPLWAIGTGNIATPEQAEEVHSFIRDLIRQLYNEDVAQKIRIIYGGSVNSNNASAILNKENIDGCLPGGASLDASEFSKIVKVQ